MQHKILNPTIMDSTCLTFHTNSYLTHPSSLLLGETTVCRLLPVASYKTLSFHPKSSSSRAHATNRQCSSSSRKSVLGRAVSEDKFSSDTSSDMESSRREELIALFKRIQNEISQEESGSGNYSDTSQASTDDDSYVETSVVEFLQQSNRGTKAETSKLKRGEEPSHKRTTEHEKSISIPQPPSTNKFTRPPSNFVKKSPIPSSKPLQSCDIEVNSGELTSSEPDKESSKIEVLKLSELKKLAKERGIRGYSKLKKSELVQLLNS